MLHTAIGKFIMFYSYEVCSVRSLTFATAAISCCGFAVQAKLPEDAFTGVNFAVKLKFQRVNCYNKFLGRKIASEGYVRWVFGYKLNSAPVRVGGK